MSKSAKKNAKRKEKRLEKIGVKDSWEDDDDDDDAADGTSPRPNHQGAQAAADDHNESADAAREVEKGKPDAAVKRKDDAVAIDDELSKGIANLDVQ
jgi:partner of Y14 and mago protein